MEALLIEYAKRFGMDRALQMLGLDKQTQNPKFTYGMPFTNNKVSINPMRMIANQGIKALTGGSSMGMALPLLAGGLGLSYLRNPLRPGSMNYNPELKGQMDYLNKNNMLSSTSSGTKYNANSILNNQNVVSMFGTNDYGKQLQKYRDKYKDTMPKERLEKLDKEIQDQITDDFDKVDKFIDTQTTNNSGNGGGGGFASQNTGTNENFSNTTGRGRTGYGRGGIASL